MTLQKIEFEYDIPDGYRFVRIDFPKRNELYVNSMGEVSPASCDYHTYWIIVEKIPEQPKRKHADLIHAFADGVDVQYISKLTGEWTDFEWDDDIEFRIKPTTKTVRFRNYLKDDGYVGVLNIKSNAPGFKEWIGDWQEVEI